MSAFRGKADMTLCGNTLLRSLLGAKRTSLFAAHMSAYDPKRTWRGHWNLRKIEHRRGQSGGWIHESGSAPNRVGGSAMILSPECEAIILRAARRVPDALRDSFFSEVATRLKFLRHITETDVRHTSAAVLMGLLEESKQRRAAG
jgi:hypothetical protein